MNIKKVRPDKNFKGGVYTPLNQSKYVGPTPIICRSNWEKKYCIYCDNNENILKWSSEPFSIEYYNPLTKKNHKYFPDFWIKVLKSDGTEKEYLVEIKPKSYLKKPVEPKRVTTQAIKNYKYLVESYVKILAKAKAAKRFASDRNMEYIILTEDSIR
jgi:hypothetical protein